MTTTSYTKVKLYGGAITAEIPSGLSNAENLRQIPDSQEVFVERVEGDDALIFDLLQEVEIEDSQALDFHIKELADLNAVSSKSLVYLTAVKPITVGIEGSKAWVAVTTQEAKKWGRDQTPLALIAALVRLERVQTDFLITLNVPFETASEQAEYKKLLEGGSSERVKTSEQIVLHVLETLHIENWTLFG